MLRALFKQGSFWTITNEKTSITFRHGDVKLWVCALELARPRGFEPLTLGLEMRGFVVTNSTELSRFVILQ